MSETSSWPVCDEEGYYQSYQNRGRWQNYWRKDNPSTINLLYKLYMSKDKNGAFEDANIDRNLPITSPYWLEKEDTEDAGDTSKTRRLYGSGIRATWIGHATVLAEIDGFNVLCDPIFGQYCGPDYTPNKFNFKRYRDPPCTINELPDNLDAILISHTHYDHLEKVSVVDLNDKYGRNIHWYVPKNSGNFFTNLGINAEDIHEMIWWEESVLKTTTIVFTPTNHYSRRNMLDENRALWGSFAVLGKHGNKFWFGGDTAYCDVFKQIGKKLGPFQLSAIPIGSYSPKEALKFNHIDPEEAIQVHNDVRSEISLGIHWGTFKTNATEFYLEPKNLIEQARIEQGKTSKGEDKLQFYTTCIGGTQEGKSVESK